MTPDQKQQFNMLQDVITEFSDNPSEKRSKSIKGMCSYNPPINKPLSKGCALGMYLSVSVAKQLDKRMDGGISTILTNQSKKLLPEWMLNMNRTFLYNIQVLHDLDSNWTETGMSNRGKDTVQHICNIYKLPFYNLKFNQS